MRKQRSNEASGATHNHTNRTSRGYEINGRWYFELRGGGQKGPYDSEEEMQAELNEFIQLHEQMNPLN
ncbi:hypothetical protein MNBD_GAMMA09-2579 [hydrothermal vent metagenome]|uniref:DUF6316 domain-containing protein n=1 Tax=hydrothermal vent metagenome TaxID=652676 RepID=A0A3B0Y7K5_9ZZZZ